MKRKDDTLDAWLLAAAGVLVLVLTCSGIAP